MQLEIMRNILVEFCGDTVSEVYGYFYTYDDIDLDIQSFVLVFNHREIVIATENDGESICIVTSRPSMINMGADGKYLIANLSENERFYSLVGQQLLKFNFWMNNYRQISGLEMSFSDCQLFVFNFGDEFFIFNEQPNFLFEEKYQRVY